MRLAIVGAGGLGGYFGARLCQGGADVHVIARGEHLEAIRSDGLRIEGPDPFHIAGVSATDDPRDVGSVDVVLLCVKLWDTGATLRLIDAIAADITASMHHDLERGRPLEVRWLSAGLVEMARRHGLPAPLNRAIADTLALHAAGTPPPASHP